MPPFLAVPFQFFRPLLAGLNRATATAATVLVTLAAATGQAQVNWTGGGADSNWGTAANWSATLATTGSTLAFSSTARTSSNNDFVTSVAGINFTNNGGTGQTGEFTLSGTSLTLGGNITTTATTSGTLTDTITLGLLLDANRTITTNTSHNLTVTGVVGQADATARNLIKAGAATLTLSGLNTFSGQLLVNAGAVSVASIGTTGATSNTGTGGIIRLGNIGNNGSLTYTGAGETSDKQFQVGAGTAAANDGGGTINANGSGGLIFSNALFNAQATGTVATNARVLTLSGTSTTKNEIQGVIRDNAGSGSGTRAVAVTKSGTATWVLSGDNTYTGTTTVAAGTLILNRGGGAIVDTGAVSVGNGTLQLNFDETIGSLTLTGTGSVTGSGTLTVSGGTISGSSTGTIAAPVGGSAGLTKTGTGTVSLSGLNTYSGPTTVSAGTLRFTRPEALYGGITASWTTSNVVTSAGASLSLAVGGTGQFSSSDVSLIAATGFASGSTLVLDTSGAPAEGFSLSTAVGDAVSGTVPLTLGKVDAGRLVLPGPNTFTGGFALGNGTANISTNDVPSAGSAGYVIVGDAGAFGTGKIVARGAQIHASLPGLVITNPTDLDAGALRFGGTNPLEFAATLTTVGGSRTIGNYSPSATLTLNSIHTAGGGITFEGGGAVTGTADIRVTGPITGTGTVTLSSNLTGRAVRLSGASTYSGTTTVSGGVLKLAADAVGAVGAITSSPIGTGTLSVGGGTLTGDDSVTLRTVLNPTTIGNGGLTVGDGVDNAPITFAASVTNSGGNRTLTNSLAGGSQLILAGPVFLSNDAAARTLTIAGSGPTVVSGVIANSATVGAAASNLTLNATGTGLLRLSGDNTYTGTTTVTAGTLVIGRDGGSIPDAGVVSLGGGTLQLDFADTIGTLTATASAAVTGPGALTLSTGSLSVSSAAATLNLSSPLAGTAGLAKSGAGTAVLSGVGGYSGATSITAGTLRFAQRQSLYGGDPTAWTAANIVVSSGATATLSAGGPGEFTAADVATIAAIGGTGVGFLAGSTLGVDTSTATGGTVSLPAFGSSDSGAALAKFGTGTLVLTGSNLHAGGTRLVAGTLELANAGALGTGAFTLSGGSLVSSVTGGFTPTTAVSSTIAGPFAFAGAEGISLGNGGTTITGAHTVTIAGPGTYTIPSLQIAMGSGFNWNITPEPGATGQLAIGSIALNSTTDTAARTRNFTVNGGTTTITGPVSDGNAFANVLGKQGTGTLLLSGNNTYSGGTTVAAGTLVVQSVTALPAGRTVTVGAATLQLDADASVGTLTVNNTGTITGSGTLSAGTFTVSNASGTSLLESPLAGTGLLTKTGAGAAVLAAANSFTGGVTITAGTVRLAADAVGSVSSITSAPLGTGTLRLDGGVLAGSDSATARTVLNPTYLTASSTIGDGINHASIEFANWFENSGGDRTLTNSLAASGTLTLAGQVRLSGGNAPRTLTLAGSGTTIVSGEIIDSEAGTAAAGSGLTKSGTGTLILASANAHTGPTTVSSGVLRVTNSLALGTTAGATAVTSGALELAGGVTLTAEPLAISGAGISNGGALRNLSGSNSWGGPITLTAAATIASSDGMLTMTGNVARSTGNTTLSLRGSGDIRIEGVIGNLGTGVVSKLDTGIATLTGLNTFATQIQIGNGTLAVDRLLNSGVASPLGTGATTPVLRFGNVAQTGTLRYVGTTAGTTNRQVAIGANSGTPAASDTGGATIENNGSAAISFTNAAFNSPLTASLAARVLTLRGSNSDANTIAGVIADNAPAAPVGLLKEGTGRWVLGGVNTYTGATTISGGTLEVSASGSLASTSGITIGPGGSFLYGGGTPLPIAPALGGSGLGVRSILGGTGTIAAAVTLDDIGDVLAPGTSPGILGFSVGQSWSAFSYDWEINDFTGTAAGSAFDQLQVTGTANLTGAAFQLNVLSLTAGNLPGPVPNFGETDRSWIILTTTQGIDGFNASNWTLNTAGFDGGTTAAGSWNVAQVGNDLVLSYTAVPEPTTLALVGLLSLGGMLTLARRRRSGRRDGLAVPAGAHRGFSLVELLVVIAIISLLASLLLPAVQAVRESARRVECGNKIRQLALAVQQHVAGYDEFPTGKLALDEEWSQHAQILPYLEQQSLFTTIDFEKRATQKVRRTHVAAFLCPSDFDRMTDADNARTQVGNARNSYKANAGNQPRDGLITRPQLNAAGNPVLADDGTPLREIDEARSFRENNGLFLTGVSIRVAHVLDGLSNTALFAEARIGDGDDLQVEEPGDWFRIDLAANAARDRQRVYDACRQAAPQAGHAQQESFSGRNWVWGNYFPTRYNHVMPPNTRSCARANSGGNDLVINGDGSATTASSRHAGGVSLALADGSTRFLADGIDHVVWWALGSRRSEAGEATVAAW